MRTDYNRLRLLGNYLLGVFFASFVTFDLYMLRRQSHVFLIFIPLVLIFSKTLIWMSGRQSAANANSARRRYEEGAPPLGGETFGGSHLDETPSEPKENP